MVTCGPKARSTIGREPAPILWKRFWAMDVGATNRACFIYLKPCSDRIHAIIGIALIQTRAG